MARKSTEISLARCAKNDRFSPTKNHDSSSTKDATNMQQPFSRTKASGPQKRIGRSEKLDYLETAVCCVVRSMRRASALSQKELAHKCGMTQSSLSRCENNQRRITVGEIQRLASALSVEPVEIWDTATTVVLDAKAIVKNLRKLPAARAIATAELVGAISRADSEQC